MISLFIFIIHEECFVPSVTDAVIMHSLVLLFHTSQSPSCCSRLRFEQTVHTETREFSNGFGLPANHRLAQRMGAHFNDSDVDSDEEIRRLVAAQQTALRQECEDDNLEVVGFDYLVKSGEKGN